MLTWLRAIVLINTAMMLVQAAFAGSMLGGNIHSVMLHELTGKALVLWGGAQILSLIFFRSRLAYPRWLLSSSIGILIAEVIEFSLGHFHQVAIHVPLGVAIFGGAVRQMVWVMRRKSENAERPVS
jgi:hypothetical protein